MKKCLIVALALAGGIVWWQRTPLLAWYYVRELSRANQESLEIWTTRVASLDTAVAPRLLSCLEAGADGVCRNVEAALVCLVDGWGTEDGRSLDLAEDMQKAFDRLGLPGRHSVLRVAAAHLRRSSAKPPPARLSRSAGDLLTTAARDPQLRGAALALAGALIERVPPGQWEDLFRNLAQQGLADPEDTSRLLAVNLTVHPPLAADARLLVQVVPLLKDSAALVRRAALVAVGPSREMIADDDLLPLLHDEDAEVRRLCAEALRSRGLEEQHILLARLISDPRAAARLQVVDHLQQVSDLEPGVWLRRLSQDSAPAVRAAAVRAAYFQTQADLRDCLRQLAGNDPSPTVRQLAQHYLDRPPLRREEY